MSILTVKITGTQGAGKSRLANHIKNTYTPLKGGKVVIIEGDEPLLKRTQENQIQPNDIVVFTRQWDLYASNNPYRYEILKDKEGQYHEVTEVEYKTYIGPKRMIQILHEIS